MNIIDKSNTKRFLYCLAVLYIVAYVIQIHQFVKLHQLESHSNEDSISTTNTHQTSKDVHIVFSTDCSGYQHYQSILSYYCIQRSGHLGPVTRIVSGCNSNQQIAIEQEFAKMTSGKTMQQQLRLHFTPSFSLKGKHYKYSNKPGGLYHWLNHTNIDESIIALIDPDMCLLRPIRGSLSDGLYESKSRRSSNLLEYIDGSGRIQLLRQTNLPPLPSSISNGIGAGQHFGIGGLWTSAGTSNARKDFRDFNLTKVCGINSPCLNEVYYNHDDTSMHPYTTRKEADMNYAVGPVYIATVSDWKEILPKWYEFTPRVHDQYPKLLAEMYGFTMAAADRQIKFALSSSYMISDPHTMSSTESWKWIDEYGMQHDDGIEVEVSSSAGWRSVCEGASTYALPTETLKRLYNYGYGYKNQDLRLVAGPLPTTLHYCQRYQFANHTFAKRKIPHDFFNCDGEPLKFDIDIILHELDMLLDHSSKLSEIQKKIQRRTAYMICHLIPLMNLALREYKRGMKC